MRNPEAKVYRVKGETDEKGLPIGEFTVFLKDNDATYTVNFERVEVDGLSDPVYRKMGHGIRGSGKRIHEAISVAQRHLSEVDDATIVQKPVKGSFTNFGTEYTMYVSINSPRHIYMGRSEEALCKNGRSWEKPKPFTKKNFGLDEPDPLELDDLCQRCRSAYEKQRS